MLRFKEEQVMDQMLLSAEPFKEAKEIPCAKINQ